MGITASNKTVNATQIECGGTFQVTLALTAEPDIVTNPVDIVLILDRSGSMSGSPLANLKNGANKFIDIIYQGSGGTDGQIGNGSRIGIVSFATEATQNTQLITSVADLQAAVNSLSAGGSTNHADAFEKALDLFDSDSTHGKIFVMFTDGVTTEGGDPTPVAMQAKSEGVIIYCIGLQGRGGLDEQALNDWSSDPDSAYVLITPDDAELEQVFEDLAKNIAKPGATDIVINERVASCFRILSILAPSKGSANLVDANSLQWTIDELGVTDSEAATLTFTVQHVGSCSGEVEVNEEVEYSDNEGNVVSFPSPSVEVDCDVDVVGEPCPEPVDLSISGCEDSIDFDAGTFAMGSLGRMVQLNVTVRSVCPNRRVALAVILSEVDDNGNECQRGIKFFTIPAHTRGGCQDVTVRCIKFVLPEDADAASTCGSGGLCRQRNLRVRMIANYIDSGFVCCDGTD